jgi:hypothetical protein
MTVEQVEFYMPLLNIIPESESGSALPEGAVKLYGALVGDHRTGALQVVAGVTSHVNNWGWQCKARGTAINISRYLPWK